MYLLLVFLRWKLFSFLSSPCHLGIKRIHLQSCMCVCISSQKLWYISGTWKRDFKWLTLSLWSEKVAFCAALWEKGTKMWRQEMFNATVRYKLNYVYVLYLVSILAPQKKKHLPNRVGDYLAALFNTKHIYICSEK